MPKKAKKALEISAKPVLINDGQKRYLLWARPKMYGKTLKRYFVTKAEAQAEQERLLKELADGGKDSVHDEATLRKHREDAKRAIARANGRVTLEQAVTFWISQNPLKENRRTVLQAKEEFYASRLDILKNGKAVRASTLKSYHKSLDNFATDMDCRVDEIQEGDITEWLAEEEWAVPTIRFHTGNIKTFFRWCLRKEFITVDPSATIITPVLDDEPIEFLTLADVVSILKAAQELYPECVPAVATSLYAGLRQSELRLLDWKEILLENKKIEVTAAKSKTRSRRLVPISKNLFPWLALAESQTGLLVPPGWRDKWVQIRKAAGFNEAKPWPRNGCRHSYATYFLANSGNEEACADAMGNSPAIIFRHYRGLVRKASDATAYWKLTPSSLDKVGEKMIKFEPAAA